MAAPEGSSPGWQSTAIYPDLKGKVVLLTGIGQTGDQSMWGNGAAAARVFAKQGARIFGCDLHLDAAEHTARRLEAEFPGLEIVVVAADVTKDEEVRGLVEKCVGRFGGVDVLVNNVGRSEPGGPAEMSPETWDAQAAVNLKSVYLTCHYVLPLMEAQASSASSSSSSAPAPSSSSQPPPPPQPTGARGALGVGGAIVNISSIAGMRYIGKPQVAYSATKAGVIQFTKATAVLYAARGVRLNVVVPGLIHTPLVGLLADKYAGGDYEGFVEKRDAAVPMGRMGDAFDVANAVVWLASVQSRYVTGQKIVVDGGVTASTG